MTNNIELENSHREHKLEVFIGNLLRWCVIVVVVVVILGAALYLPSHQADVPDYRVFRSEPDAFRSVSGIVTKAFTGDALGVVQLGLVMLVLTPILRVALSAVAFLFEKDKLYVVMTLVVLGLLLYSLVAG